MGYRLIFELRDYWELLGVLQFLTPNISTPKFAAKKNWRVHLTSGHVVPWPSVCSQKQKKGFGPEILGKRVSHAKFGLVKPGFLEVQLGVSAVENDLPGEREERHPGRDGGGGAAWGWCLGALDPRWVSRKNIGCECGNVNRRWINHCLWIMGVPSK